MSALIALLETKFFYKKSKIKGSIAIMSTVIVNTTFNFTHYSTVITHYSTHYLNEFYIDFLNMQKVPNI